MKRLLVALVGSALLAVVQPARAALITSVSGSTSTSVSTQGGPEPQDYYAEAAFFEDCGAACTSLTGRLGANAGIEADTGENIRIDVTWSYTIDIVVDAGASEAWDLVVDAELAGYLTIVDQGSGRGSARVTDLSGSLDTAGLGLSGSMDLLGSDSLNSSSTANQAISRMGSFRVTGGFGPQTVSMSFSLDGRLRSQCSGGSCGPNGDEAAIRLGLPPSAPPPGFTAGDYSGIPPDVPGANGHFLRIALIAVPEPQSWVLLLAALPLALGRRGGRR